MQEYESKREVPPAVKNILQWDVENSKRFVIWANNFMPLRSLKNNAKMLEISCHGIPWFAFWIAFSWLFNQPSLVPLQINILIGLFLDIVVVAVAKAYFRRRRPAANKNDAVGEIGPDHFSFPSGHASRACFVTVFFTLVYPVNIIFVPPLLAWTSSVCLSRVLMSRHYVLDVIGGVVLGFVEGILMCLLALSDEHAKYLMSFLSDETVDGGDYHV